jgi:quercetin dioxygenase-like cupin family protein
MEISNEFDKGSKFNFNESINYAEKAIVSKHVLKKSSGNITLFAFDKGEGLSAHTTPFDALVNIIDGTADILIDGKSNILQAGENIIMAANIPHALVAIEKFKMVLTMIKTT